ncbi:MAG: type II toxin-antitoxin system VapB family antitoxin [Eubacterium sp.]|nr:type II toxin-antitoxin system VapB family antitoxin [Eubacterium sp.]
METAKIFTNGGSQAVRLPKTCRFDDDEVLVQKIGNVVMLIPKSNRWASMFRSLDLFTDDFYADPSANMEFEKRESL